LKSVIVGTAGHIDHGKSTLIEALTGTHPDRLEEEKRRGITIDLGFAFLEEQGVRFGFVDVPGHERFVKNMLAGATGIDLVMLVIAGDEGIRPQTREHFEICRLLGVKHGLIAITKSDAVDEDARELMKLEVEEYVKGSFLESAPVLAVSAKSGAGLEELKGALLVVAAQLREKDAKRYLRLPIDRSFAVKGFGTVVTGTLISGGVVVGEEVELLPAKKILRVRGVQTGGKSVERAEAGQRTAVNLSGVDHAEVHRGMAIVAPGRLRNTKRIDVRLELLAGAAPLKQRARVHFHLGTAETVGEVVFFDAKELAPGGNRLAQLRLQEEIVAVREDRFIVRQFSPVITIGGGEVLDPLARRAAKKDNGRVAFLEKLENGSREEVLQAIVERNILGVTGEEITARTGWLAEEVRASAEKLAGAKGLRIISVEPLVLLGDGFFRDVERKLFERVERFQKDNPLLPGIAREDLRASLGKRTRVEAFRAALQELLETKKLAAQGEMVKKAGSEITLTASVSEVLAQLAIEKARAEKILQILLREKILVRVSTELVFHAAALQRLAGMLKEYKKAKGERIGVPSFKELTGITRKYAIPLLEYLDRQRVTRRAGDERVIL
jgi:selenocysteine-specific elongation factor